MKFTQLEITRDGDFIFLHQDDRGFGDMDIDISVDMVDTVIEELKNLKAEIINEAQNGK